MIKMIKFSDQSERKQRVKIGFSLSNYCQEKGKKSKKQRSANKQSWELNEK